MPITKKRGFTLVELLIVVAVIGVLSTIGVPTARKMIRKAKQAEAKTSLGGLYRTEAAFHAEYGAFGNNLFGMGFEIDGQLTQDVGGLFWEVHPGRYTIGFPTKGEGAEPKSGKGRFKTKCQANQEPVPKEGPGWEKLKAQNPAYLDSLKAKATYLAVGLDPNSTFCETSSIPNDGANFRATATAMLKPLDAATADAGDFDVWTIDQDRAMRNTQSGLD